MISLCGVGDARACVCPCVFVCVFVRVCLQLLSLVKQHRLILIRQGSETCECVCVRVCFCCGSCVLHTRTVKVFQSVQNGEAAQSPSAPRCRGAAAVTLQHTAHTKARRAKYAFILFNALRV